MNDLINTQDNKVDQKRRYNMHVPSDMSVDMTIDLMITILNFKPMFYCIQTFHKLIQSINYKTNKVTISIIHKDFDSGSINKFKRLES